MKKTSVPQNRILFLSVPLMALILYVIKLISGYTNSEGTIYIGYTSYYPLILLSGFVFVSLLFIPYIIRSKNEEQLGIHLIPLMLFACLGMITTDADTMITSREADYSPMIMFLIFFVTLTAAAFSGYTLICLIGTTAGSIFFPAFSMCFAPVLTAAAFLLKDKSPLLKRISVILNGLLTAVFAVLHIVKSEAASELSFSKKYIPAILFAVFIAVFFILKKEWRLVPLCILPLLTLLTGIFYNSFPTPLLTLSVSVTPSAVLFFTSALTDGNEKIKGYALKIVHNPLYYILTAVFILRTAYPLFVAPGFLRDVYV